MGALTTTGLFILSIGIILIIVVIILFTVVGFNFIYIFVFMFAVVMTMIGIITTLAGGAASTSQQLLADPNVQQAARVALMAA